MDNIIVTTTLETPQQTMAKIITKKKKPKNFIPLILFAFGIFLIGGTNAKH